MADWLAEVLPAIMSGLIAVAITVTLMMARKDKNREIRERRAAKVKMLLDAHMNLWRGLRQMEALATRMPHKPMSGEGHVLLVDDFRWLRDVLRNGSLMLAPEIHGEYGEFLKKSLRTATSGFGDHVPTSVLIYGGAPHKAYWADLSKMQQIAEEQWKKHEVEYNRLGGEYPHAD